jgi:hypothetical protein
LWEKLKPILADDGFYLSLLVLVVAVASFGLGRASVPIQSPGEATVALVAPPVMTSVAPGEAADPQAVPASTVVASKNGTRYHLESCPGARQISEENMITFASEAEARAAGYTPAANCPALSR